MKPVGRWLLLLGACALGGCATAQTGSLAARFVKPGVPAVDLGGPPAASGAPAGPAKAAAVPAQPARPAQAAVAGTTVETADPRLAAALLLEAMLPTADSRLQVAREYLRLGVLDAAFDRVNRAIAAAPRSSEAHEMIARIWRDWGFPARGLGAAYRAVAFAPGSAGARNTLGTIFERLGSLDDARREYTRSIALDPAAPWAMNNLCYVEFRLGRIEEARRFCEAALRIEPAFVAAHNNLALTFAARGDLDRARQEFLAAGDAATAEYNLGIVGLADGDYAGAAQRFEEAIKVRPAYAAAKARAHAARLRVLTGRE